MYSHVLSLYDNDNYCIYYLQSLTIINHYQPLSTKKAPVSTIIGHKIVMINQTIKLPYINNYLQSSTTIFQSYNITHMYWYYAILAYITLW